MKHLSPQIGGVTATKKSSKGFTLLELLISLLILATISGAVFEQINRMQKRASSEAMKLDQNQQAREFIDQTVRDLHMAGYPGRSMYSDPDAHPYHVAQGLVSVSPTQIVLEGDVYNDGKVYSVNISYVANDPNDPSCPCVRRSAIEKIDADSFSQPTTPNYTETSHVLPPGTGPGQSGEDLFAYYDQKGDPVDVSVFGNVSTENGILNLATIKTVKINLSLLTRDTESNGFTRTSMSATSRLNY
jgi:prepilin-type N-terminal cleavage/methylation domain-containing protein